MYVEQFFWILVLLWSAISALFQYPTWLRALPDMCAHFLPRWIPAWGLWEIDSTYYGVVPPLFLTPKELSSACAVAVVSLISGVTDVVILSFLLWHSSAPAINFVLEVSGEKLGSNLLRLTNSSCSGQQPIYLFPQILIHLVEMQAFPLCSHPTFSHQFSLLA